MNMNPDLFSIGEFSQITGLSVKALRFYDEKGVLRPAQVDPVTGYRYYNGESMKRARMVARLRELQFSLDDIQRVLASCDDDTQLVSYFTKHLKVIQERLRADTKTAKALEAAIAGEVEARQFAEAEQCRVEEKTVASMIVAGVRMTGRYEECGRGFKTLGSTMGRHIAGKPLCLYYDGEYREEEAQFEPCFPLRRVVAPAPGIDVRTLPEMRCLSLVHRGPYPQLGRSYQRLLAELKRRSMAAALPTREVYLKGPGIIFRGNPRNYLTEIQIPILDA